jgi:hypothetical protein
MEERGSGSVGVRECGSVEQDGTTLRRNHFKNEPQQTATDADQPGVHVLPDTQRSV